MSLIENLPYELLFEIFDFVIGSFLLELNIYLSQDFPSNNQYLVPQKIIKKVYDETASGIGLVSHFMYRILDKYEDSLPGRRIIDLNKKIYNSVKNYDGNSPYRSIRPFNRYHFFYMEKIIFEEEFRIRPLLLRPDSSKNFNLDDIFCFNSLYKPINNNVYHISNFCKMLIRIDSGKYLNFDYGTNIIISFENSIKVRFSFVYFNIENKWVYYMSISADTPEKLDHEIFIYKNYHYLKTNSNNSSMKIEAGFEKTLEKVNKNLLKTAVSAAVLAIKNIKNDDKIRQYLSFNEDFLNESIAILNDKL
jgi:hypothetical protein